MVKWRSADSNAVSGDAGNENEKITHIRNKPGHKGSKERWESRLEKLSAQAVVQKIDVSFDPIPLRALRNPRDCICTKCVPGFRQVGSRIPADDINLFVVAAHTPKGLFDCGGLLIIVQGLERNPASG